jgi:amidase
VVAAGAADFGLGTDTGGSVRVPASFCGLYGIRPTHGRLDLTGMLPQAPTSDTTGWFTRDAATFRRVSEVLLQENIEDSLPTRLVVAVDAFGFADADTRTALQPLLEKLGGLAGEVVEDVMAPQGISVWGRAQRVLQMAEAWNTFRDWIETSNPRFAFNVARGLLTGSMLPEAEKQAAALMQREARARLEYLLPPGTVLVMPTTPFAAPKKNLPLPEQNQVREMILGLCAHGGLAGLPQVSIPGALIDGAPVGLSILAGRNEDARLVALADALEKASA